MPKTPQAQVAFLRGINVGGNKKVPMADLRALVSDLGYADVSTHLQSGNVIFRTAAAPTKTATAISEAIESTLGLQVAVVTRTRDQIAATLKADPFGPLATNPSRYLVVFLDARPKAADLARLTALEAGDERVECHGHELYAWMPEGIHASKISAALARNVLGTTTWTGRNWNTVTAVLDLMDQLGQPDEQ